MTRLSSTPPNSAMVIFFFILFLLLGCVNAFHTDQHGRSMERNRIEGLFSKQPVEFDENKKVSSFYNDDAFGLVFLTALCVENDVAFGGIFGILSGLAAVAVKNGAVSFVPLLPGATAAVALALGQGIHAARGEDVGSVWEIATCVVSIGWGLVQQQQSQDQNS
jgi:hypothetical protein